MIVLTNKDAPRYKVVTVDLADEHPVFKDLIPEDPEALLKDVTPVHDDKLMLVYQRNVKDELYVYSRSGEQLERLASDFVGSMSVTGRQTKQPEVFITLAGFTTPGTVAKYDLALPKEERKVVDWRTTVLKGLNPMEFSAEQVWYESKDGTKIPMFVVKHADTKFDGTAPAIQYGYGGFDISITPSFTPHILTFLKHYGGVFAVANIRGGGEFGGLPLFIMGYDKCLLVIGEEWHQAGMREKKVCERENWMEPTFLTSY
jgi:prolyl oligopeptidase